MILFVYSNYNSLKLTLHYFLFMLLSHDCRLTTQANPDEKATKNLKKKENTRQYI